MSDLLAAVGIDFPLLVVIVMGIVIFALVGLLIADHCLGFPYFEDDPDASMSIYVGILAVFVGVNTAFIIANEWTAFTLAALDISQEAGLWLGIYVTLLGLPDTERLRALVIEYLEDIIHVEMPAIGNGEVPTCNSILDTIIQQMYTTIDVTSSLGTQLVAQVNQAIQERSDRINRSTNGIPAAIWLVIGLGMLILIVSLWFVQGSFIFRASLITLIAILCGISIFLAITLDYPYQGALSVSTNPFQRALDQIACINKGL